MFYIIAVLKSLLKIFVKNLLVIPCLHREQTLLVYMLSDNLGMSFFIRNLWTCCYWLLKKNKEDMNRDELR